MVENEEIIGKVFFSRFSQCNLCVLLSMNALFFKHFECVFWKKNTFFYFQKLWFGWKTWILPLSPIYSNFVFQSLLFISIFRIFSLIKKNCKSPNFLLFLTFLLISAYTKNSSKSNFVHLPQIMLTNKNCFSFISPKENIKRVVYSFDHQHHHLYIELIKGFSFLILLSLFLRLLKVLNLPVDSCNVFFIQFLIYLSSSSFSS